MKKFFVMLLALSFAQMSFAYEAANIKIRINGAIHDNSYFLCLPNVGCMSIYAAEKKGKIYPVLHSLEMPHIYVTNVNDFSVHAQGLPESCKVTVKTDQTITINGTLSVASNGQVHINNLRCSVA